jgi:hypothetical protein
LIKEDDTPKVIRINKIKFFGLPLNRKRKAF